MRTFALDHNNDICLCEYGKIKSVDGIQSVLFRCENYAKAALGEMVAKKDKGMPFFQTAFGARPNVPLFEAWFRRRMREVDGVLAVREFNAYIRENELRYTATIETKYGLGEFNG